MAPLPWWLLWPLRKAAIVPAVVISLAAAGGAWGSFELTTTVARLVVTPPKKGKARTGTGTVAASAGLLSGAGVVWVRETLFRPDVPPAPKIDMELGPSLTPAQLSQLLKRAYASALHTIIYYPYKHRIATCFMAGAVAGAAYVSAESLYNPSPSSLKKSKAQKAAAKASARGEQLEGSEETIDFSGSGGSDAAGGRDGRGEMEMQSDSADDEPPHEHDREDGSVNDHPREQNSAEEARARRREQVQLHMQQQQQRRRSGGPSREANPDYEMEDAHDTVMGSGVEYEDDPYTDGRRGKAKAL